MQMINPEVLGNQIFIFSLQVHAIDLTDYLFLPNSLVSMLTHFSLARTDGNQFQCFSAQNCFWLISG